MTANGEPSSSTTTEIELNAEVAEQSDAVSVEVAPPGAPQPAQAKPLQPWPEFLREATRKAIAKRLCAEISGILKAHGLDQDCCLAIHEPDDGIDSFELDKIFAALSAVNPHHDKRVVLFVVSAGGSIEPAYQISKLCKSFSHGNFVVVVVRQAKSAATMIAIGADEIHMGPLGQLGPIDPQIGGMPALGVSQALQTIASMVQQHPASAEMFARYLRLSLTVEQIGYCERISESAVQYAVRLLSTKPSLVSVASRIASELVYEYKHHGFVIDVDEAKKHLGDGWIKTDTPELKAAERIYTLLDLVNFFLKDAQSKRILIAGCPAKPSSVLMLDVETD